MVLLSLTPVGTVLAAFILLSLQLLLLILLIQALRTLRREGVQTTCVASWLIFLLALLLAMIAFVLGVLRPFHLSASLVFALSVGGGMLILGCLFGSLILAIVGLISYRREQHQVGRWQAAVTLAMASVCLGLILHQLESRRQPQGASPAMAQALGRLEFEDENCVLQPPPGWRRVSPPAGEGTENRLLLVHDASGASLSLVAETVEGLMRTEDLLKAVQQRMDEAGHQVVEECVTAETVHGQPFLRRAFKSLETARQPAHYSEQWLTTRPGYAWQILGWGPPERQEELSREIRLVAESFRVLHPDRVAPWQALVRNVERPDWGYRTDLPVRRWRQWVESLPALAHFAAERPSEALVILTLDLGATPPDLHLVASALLARVGIDYPHQGAWTTQPWPTVWGEGLEIRGSHTRPEGSMKDVFRIVARGSLVHLQAGWVAAEAGDLPLLEEALAAVQLVLPNADQPPLHQAAQQQAAIVLNDMALSLSSRQDWRGARPWLERAASWHEAEWNILANLLETYRHLGEISPAQQLLDQRLQQFPNQPQLHWQRAMLLAEEGRFQEGQKAFLKALSLGHSDEQEVLTWLQKLTAASQLKYARAAAQAWMEQAPGLNSRLWHAQHVNLAGDAQKALVLLEELAREFPEDLRVWQEQAEVLNQLGQFSRSAALSQKLLDEDDRNLRALISLGCSQMNLQRYAEAHATLSKAAQLAPGDAVIQNSLHAAEQALQQAER